MSMNLSPSLASHIVIVSLPVILENNGIAALMENQSHPEHLCTSSFFFSYCIYFFLFIVLEDLALRSLIHIMPINSKQLFRFSLLCVLLLLPQNILWL